MNTGTQDKATRRLLGRVYPRLVDVGLGIIAIAHSEAEEASLLRRSAISHVVGALLAVVAAVFLWLECC